MGEPEPWEVRPRWEALEPLEVTARAAGPQRAASERKEPPEPSEQPEPPEAEAFGLGQSPAVWQQVPVPFRPGLVRPEPSRVRFPVRRERARVRFLARLVSPPVRAVACGSPSVVRAAGA